MTPDSISTTHPEPSERILALDLGKRRTGLALGSLESGLATPHSTVELPFPSLIDHLRELAQEEGSRWVLIGDPKLPSGDASEIGVYARRVARALEETGLRVILWDEGLTSWEAERILRERHPPKRAGRGEPNEHRRSGKRGGGGGGGARDRGKRGGGGAGGGRDRGKRGGSGPGGGGRGGRGRDRGEIDRLAAALLLQDYLDHHRVAGLRVLPTAGNHMNNQDDRDRRRGQGDASEPDGSADPIDPNPPDDRDREAR